MTWQRVLLLVLVTTAIAVAPRFANGQYMYLDVNGNGVHDAGDRMNSSGGTTFSVWLDTDTNKDGSSAICTNGSEPLSISGYQFCLRAMDGSVAWSNFINQMSGFTQQFLSYSDPQEYTNGYGVQFVYSSPGLYKLATMTVTPTSGTPRILIVSQLSGSPSAETSFQSQCPGVEFRSQIKLGVDWFGTGGIAESRPWPQNGTMVCDLPDYQFENEMVTDGTGGAIVAWKGHEYGWWNVRTGRVNGTGASLWVPGWGVELSSSTPAERKLPRLATDGAGGAYVVWTDASLTGSWDVLARRVTSTGAMAWPTVAISDVANHQDNQRVIPDGAGGAIIVWDDARTSPGLDIYAQRLNSDGTVSWTADGVQITNNFYHQQNPEIASDGAGGAIIVWTDQRTPDPGLYAQRITSSGATSWQANGVQLFPGWNSAAPQPKGVSSLASSDDISLAIAPDGAGGAYIAVAGGAQVSVQRINASGVTQWGNDGTIIATPGRYPRMTATADSGCIVAWIDTRNANDDIYAMRVRNNGTTAWPGNGVPICAATGAQYEMEITEDGQRGAVLVWRDARGASDDIYAQRLTVHGSRLWGVNGAPLCTDPATQRSPAITSDGQSGAVVSWLDYRPGSYESDVADVYVGRIYASGQHVVTMALEEEAPEPSDVNVRAVPNPFNPKTNILFDLDRDAEVAIRVLSIEGRLIRELRRETMIAGHHTVHWDGTDRHGRALGSGVYFIELQIGTERSSSKAVLIR